MHHAANTPPIPVFLGCAFPAIGFQRRQNSKRQDSEMQNPAFESYEALAHCGQFESRRNAGFRNAESCIST